MSDFSVGVISILVLLGLIYFGIIFLAVIWRSIKMIWNVGTIDNTKKQYFKDLEDYRNIVNDYFKQSASFSPSPMIIDSQKLMRENIELKNQLDSAHKEIEVLTKGRVLYDRLVVAQLQLQEWQKSFKKWKSSDTSETADLELIKSFEKNIDTSMLKRYVADELRVLADTAPINGNHIAQSRVLMAANQYESGKITN